MVWYADLAHDQAGGDGGLRPTTQMIVLHCTDNTASDESEAHYAENRSDQTSAHFYSDEDSVIQALDTTHIAYGCFPTGNARSIQFEMTGRSNQISDATMRRVAPIVARVCRDWNIPIRHIGPDELRAGAKGICGHGDVTRAWGEGDHTDPGDNFPWATFISYVQGGDMELSDVVAGTKTPGFNPNDRTVGQIAMDQANIRAVHYGELPVTSLPAGAPLRHLYELLPALEKLAAGPVAAVDAAAVAAALQPVIAKTVADEFAKRLES